MGNTIYIARFPDQMAGILMGYFGSEMPDDEFGKTKLCKVEEFLLFIGLAGLAVMPWLAVAIFVYAMLEPICTGG